MADPLSISSGLIAIVTATVQSSKALHDAVQSFKSHPRTIRQLLDELAALNGALRSLEDFVSCDDSSFLSLRLPLTQCCNACTEFEALIAKCNKHSEGSRTSLRDWAKLRYMDSDVAGFTNTLAGYKSTICIALADANLRSSTVTLNVLNEYKDMINSTTQDLEDHLDDINAKLQSLAAPSTSRSGTSTDERRFQDERDSTEQCLEICAQVLAHIDEMRLQPLSKEASPRGTSPGFASRDLTRAHIMTLSTLKECSDKLSDTLSLLHIHREDTVDRLQTKETPLPRGLEPDPELEARRLATELNSTKQCLAICTDASQLASSDRVHVLEDINVSHDGQQLFVSTLRDLFRVKGASAGDRAIQFVGTVSESSLQEFFRMQNRR
ncbi:Fc.00g025200.m01.CDS01 [Cosmosporella sp. VM-42]